MKLAGSSNEPATSQPESISEPESFPESSNTDSNEKPFDDEPFDAGVEADESSDPKKFIEQLTGKLGQSLRKYNEEQGQPDFELEKFAINSLLSATHTSEMDSEDQDDIINKVKEAGKNDNNDNNDGNDGNEKDNSGNTNDNASNSDNASNDFGGDFGDSNGGNTETTGEVSEITNLFIEPKKNNMFQPNSNDILEKNLDESKKISIFDKIKLKDKLYETFNQDDMTEPMTEPMVKPTEPSPTKTPTEPMVKPSRKNKPFLPMPNVKPDPKAIK